MFRLRKPDEQLLRRIKEHYRDLPLTYTETGCSREEEPVGYTVDHYRIQLGTGRTVFENARAALCHWQVLQLGWVQPCWPDASVKEGTLVCTLARVFGLWTLNVCRIVYITDDDGPVARFGFGYGTLPGHLERGEERFQVEWNKTDDFVWYDIRVVSKPGGWLTWLAYPLARWLQHRFGRDSLQAMSEKVRQ